MESISGQLLFFRFYTFKLIISERIFSQAKAGKGIARLLNCK